MFTPPNCRVLGMPDPDDDPNDIMNQVAADSFARAFDTHARQLAAASSYGHISLEQQMEHARHFAASHFAAIHAMPPPPSQHQQWSPRPPPLPPPQWSACTHSKDSRQLTPCPCPCHSLLLCRSCRWRTSCRITRYSAPEHKPISSCPCVHLIDSIACCARCRIPCSTSIPTT